MNSNYYPKQTGAVLLAVLVIALILTLLLSAAHTIMSDRLSVATEMTQHVKGKAAAHAKMQELIYLAATQRKTRAGISRGIAVNDVESFILGDEIRVDGFEYTETINDQLVTFSVQAEEGLIPINTPNAFFLRQYLQNKGLNLIEVNKLIDSLFDYADGDDLLRPMGSERLAYRNKNKTALFIDYPGNYLLQNAQELWMINHWTEFLTSVNENTGYFNTRRVSSMNFNAIPAALWAELWPESAQQVALMRAQNKWFISLSDIQSVLPNMATLDDEYKTISSEIHFRIIVGTPHSAEQIRIVVGSQAVTPFNRYTF